MKPIAIRVSERKFRKLRAPCIVVPWGFWAVAAFLAGGLLTPHHPEQ